MSPLFHKNTWIGDTFPSFSWNPELELPLKLKIEIFNITFNLRLRAEKPLEINFGEKHDFAVHLNTGAVLKRESSCSKSLCRICRKFSFDFQMTKHESHTFGVLRHVNCCSLKSHPTARRRRSSSSTWRARPRWRTRAHDGRHTSHLSSMMCVRDLEWNVFLKEVLQRGQTYVLFSKTSSSVVLSIVGLHGFL